MIGLFLALLIGPLYMAVAGGISTGNDWRSADRSSTGLAPDPSATSEAVVQVYAARAFNWRGVFAVHTWIAIKPEGDDGYTVMEVLGWRGSDTEPVVSVHRSIPDRSWYGNEPEVLLDLRGESAATAIEQLSAALPNYPFARDYTLWPGPNSNTFIAWLARHAPALALDLPPTAIGKDFLGLTQVFAKAPSGTGFQLSLFGVLGVLVAVEEGLEINVLGLALGVDPLDLALKVPGIGRIGVKGIAISS